ncbi:MAG: repair protein RecN [Actinomycetota bacterium]|jgi:DNA repair protein RecN (Recombination protein N)
MMLTELSIENLGVIESVRLTFGGGFTALTGETGAGKTMLVEAINLVVGRRADASVVRAGAEEARVEARFVDADGADTVLSRVVQASGGSRAYVNGRMATVATLAEMGEALLDIHGQHAHQRLLSAAAQRAALDSFAGVDLEPLRVLRGRLTEIDAMLATLGGDERTRAREIDLLRFQIDEITSAAIDDADEDARLEAEEDRLGDVVRLREALWSTSAALSGDRGAAERLGEVARLVRGIPSLKEIGERIESILALVDDVGGEVREQLEAAEEDPERLEAVRLRRQLFRDLRRKYGETLADVTNFGRESAERLAELESHSERVEELERARGRVLQELLEAQLVVGDSRRRAAPALGRAVEKHLATLAMPSAQVNISVGDAAGDPAGDTVVFLLAANPGSPALPLSKVASGGELARTMLALRLVLTSEPGTMVFDEVDAGIGGEAAVAVAAALRELGSVHQVFAVTHLPHVAAAAHHQVKVEKHVAGGVTYGSARPVEGDDRRGEIARMISGGLADDTALVHASELLATFGAPVVSKRKKR